MQQKIITINERTPHRNLLQVFQNIFGDNAQVDVFLLYLVWQIFKIPDPFAAVLTSAQAVPLPFVFIRMAILILIPNTDYVTYRCKSVKAQLNRASTQ
ncbi:MAG: hypothetical protein C0390_07940 [Syntrophus sp. (in: bacteria)]|nr:hypothetical protein [Syntrophus sp. (in: bacteria)]